MSEAVLRHGQRVIREVVPAEYQPSLPRALKLSMTVVGVCLAWRFQRHISAIQVGWSP